MRYRLGLDIGIASVGWAVINADLNRIEDLGVRTFEKAENPQDGKALAEPRREKRGARRRLRRKKHRIERLKSYFESIELIRKSEIEELYAFQLENSPWDLRVKALDALLTKKEFAQAIIHIGKRRGFKSNRKSDSEDKEAGKLLTAVKENEKILTENGYRTVGEMFAKDPKFAEIKRNKNGVYNSTILRSDMEKEIDEICNTQIALHSIFVNKEVLENIKRILFYQRDFNDGPSKPSPYYSSPEDGGQIGKMLGKCTFEKNEKRSPKNTYSGERFVLLQKVNNLRIVNDGNTRSLDEVERRELIEKCYDSNSAEIKYSHIRKFLKLAEDDKFNALTYNKADDGKKDKTEDAKFATLKGTFLLVKNKKNNLSKDYIEKADVDREIRDIADKILTIISIHKSDSSIENELKKLGIPNNDIREMMKFPSLSGTLNLSLKAINNLLPYLEDGFTYDKACESHYGYFNEVKSNVLKEKFLKPVSKEDVTNPVVLRAVSQSIKVINGVIGKYGSPFSVHIEVTNEVAKSFKERQDIIKVQEKNRKEKERMREKLVSLGIEYPKAVQILKYRLYEEQECKCLYSLEPIDLNRLLSDDRYCDVDHIIPYSRSMDDSFANKALVFSSENAKKSNMTPREYFKKLKSNVSWSEYKEKIHSMKNISYRKKNNLLKESFSKEDSRDWKERNINDTRYINRFLKNYIERGILFAEENHGNIQRVFSITGKLTTQLRARWGIKQKDRSSDLHHAQDAAIVANIHQGLIMKMAKYSIRKEIPNADDVEVAYKDLIDEETGEILNIENLYTGEKLELIDDKHFPVPWHEFRNELEHRLYDEDPKEYFTNILKDLRLSEYYRYDDEFISKLRCVNVSRAPRRKVTGQAHEETIRSVKGREKGTVVTKVPITSLNLKDLETMYNKESDLSSYNAIKERLEMYNDNPEKAFATPLYKPAKNGKGPEIKGIKVQKNQTTGVMVNEGLGANGNMVRIDVFTKNKKFYVVPIYVHQTKEKELPNRAITAGKDIDQWDVIDDSYKFMYSFYKNDLIKFIFKKEEEKANLNTLTNNNLKKVCGKSFIGYYEGTDSSDGRILISSISNDYILRIASKTVDNIEKYQIDVLGNISKVRLEKRQSFNKG